MSTIPEEEEEAQTQFENGSLADGEGEAYDANPIDQINMEEMLMENRSLKESLMVCLEFKRLLEHIFEDQEVLKSGVVNKYKHHYWKNYSKYRAYRKAFGDHLVQAIENIDNAYLTKCFTKECELPGCNDFEHEFNETLPLSDGPPLPLSPSPEANEDHEDSVDVNGADQENDDEEEEAEQNQEDDAQANGENGYSQVSENAASPGSVASIITPGPPPTKRLRPIDAPDTSAGSNDATSSNTSEAPSRPVIASTNVPVVNVKQEIENEIEPITTTPGNVIRCKVTDCKLTFDHPSKANEHYKTHSKLFKCSVCSALFSTKTLVFRHFIVHNPGAAKSISDGVVDNIRNNKEN